MNLKILFAGNRSVCAQLEDGGLYAATAPRTVYLNGEPAGTVDTVVFSLYELEPATTYTLTIPEADAEATFTTLPETVTLDVRRFGAKGDGVHDDTAAIQAAITCCPKDGRVLIPAGQYAVLPLFLKSHIRVELAKGATLQLQTDRERFPILPGMLEGTTPDNDCNLGSWEGDPLDCFAALITGMDVEDVILYGEGLLDGQAPKSDWWVDPKKQRIAWRGRMVFLNHCRDITLQGVSVANSPSWNLHPYFSQNLRFLNVTVTAPANSPNTDGFDPESCSDVTLAGCHFSLGDDCIAIKSGKITMGTRYHTPCTRVDVGHSLMENGHGGVTVGSEMAGGVNHVLIHDCLMRHTDRGLRIKTRRGRGKYAIVDNITFENVVMEQVGTPLVMNAMYFCDWDGHSDYVQNRSPLPVDDRTPTLGQVTFRDVTATGAACAGYLLGLPERPITGLTMERVSITCSPDAKPMQPAMADGVPVVNRTGLVAINTAEVIMKDVSITGMDGEALVRM